MPARTRAGASGRARLILADRESARPRVLAAAQNPVGPSSGNDERGDAGRGH